MVPPARPAGAFLENAYAEPLAPVKALQASRETPLRDRSFRARARVVDSFRASSPAVAFVPTSYSSGSLFVV